VVLKDINGEVAEARNREIKKVEQYSKKVEPLKNVE
jgi:hypothetical protein